MATDVTNITDEPRPIASTPHFIALIGLLAALVVKQFFQLRWMDAHPGSNPHWLSRAPFCVLMIAIQWALVGYIWFGIRKYGLSIRQLVGGEWRNAWGPIRDVALGIGFCFVWVFAIGLVMLKLNVGKHPIDYFTDLWPQTRMDLFLWMILSISVGFNEELVFRGYIQRQLWARTNNYSVAVLGQAMAFGVGHVYQGAFRASAIVVLGILFSLLAKWRQSLRPGMVTHVCMDAMAGFVMFLHQ